MTWSFLTRWFPRKRSEHITYCDAPGFPEMLVIKRGYFRMGTDRPPTDIYMDEAPARECSVNRDFAVSKYPVTFEKFFPFVERSRASDEARNFFAAGARSHPRLPAVMVDWHTARNYCEWLTFLTSSRYRLLTETEWEYVCRAGTESAYWWGDSFRRGRANGRSKTAPLGQFTMPGSYAAAAAELRCLTKVDRYPPNPWGVCDMLGNVWEWVEDVYNYRGTDPETYAPALPDGEGFRCVRGGSWMGPPLSLRCATRSWAHPSALDRNIGFRIARELDGS